MTYDEQIAKSRDRFARETAEHRMTVLRDDGLYRHLRFQKPDTWSYGFDLVTWPGYLAVVGDCGDFVFSRVRDMFEFFGPSGARGGFEDARWGINPQYWSEKLQAPRPDGAERYSYEAFKAAVLDWFEGAADGLDDTETAALRQAVQEQVIADPDGFAYHSEQEARRRMDDFEHDGLRIYDSWEWSLREYDWQFLWCCWAIVWGIGQYRKAREARAA